MEKKANLSDGYIRIANSLFKAIRQANLTAREFKVLLFIIEQTYGFNHKERELSNSYIAKGVGIARPHICSIIQSLEVKRIIFRRLEGSRRTQIIGINTQLSEWLTVTTGGNRTVTTGGNSATVTTGGNRTVTTGGNRTVTAGGTQYKTDIKTELKTECGGNKFPPTQQPVFESLWDEWQWSKIGKDKVPRRCRDEVEKIGYRRMTDARYRYQEYFASLSTQNNQPLSARTWFTEGYKQFLPKIDNDGFWTAIGGERYKHKNGKDVLIE